MPHHVRPPAALFHAGGHTRLRCFQEGSELQPCASGNQHTAGPGASLSLTKQLTGQTALSHATAGGFRLSTAPTQQREQSSARRGAVTGCAARKNVRGKTCRVSVGAAKPEQRRCGAGGTAKEERSGKGERTGRSEGGDGGKPHGSHRPVPRPLLTLQVLLRRAEPRHGGVELGTRSARRSVRLRAAVTAAPLPLGAAALPPSANGRGGEGRGRRSGAMMAGWGR